jgi:hypothetical protein
MRNLEKIKVVRSDLKDVEIRVRNNRDGDFYAKYILVKFEEDC